jgi:hypothetical protein
MQTNTLAEHRDDFPHVGFRARRWQRFERDLHAWLATPEGRFTTWCAQRQLATSVTAATPASTGVGRVE